MTLCLCETCLPQQTQSGWSSLQQWWLESSDKRGGTAVEVHLHALDASALGQP